MDYVIRAVRAEEWAKAREIRLVALQDPAAPIAFLESYEQAVERPDGFWQDRTSTAAQGVVARQFIAEAPRMAGGWGRSPCWSSGRPERCGSGRPP